MKVRSIRNPENQTTWDLKPSRWPLKSKASCRSKIQYAVGVFLAEKFPFDPILEDVTIPESRLSLDFFLPQRMIAVEVQGIQHFQMNPFFHKTKADFQNQKKRDHDKDFFCELNDINLILVKSVEELKEVMK